ncbi:MAG: DUF177 domain-containing protein [Anaerolineales bacterium]|nr:DUF177 domain-containing protein [Anaerolineales bacterium]
MASRILRLNVGFLLREGIGYSREFIFDEPVVQVADDITVQHLRGAVTLTRTPQGLYAQGQLQGTVEHECTRCLTGIDQPVSLRLSELYHFPPETAPADAPTVSDDAHLDLTPVVREDFLLSIPMQSLCRPDCKGLCSQCGKNWNEGPCDCPGAERDPRWSGLLGLLKEEPPPA